MSWLPVRHRQLSSVRTAGPPTRPERPCAVTASASSAASPRPSAAYPHRDHADARPSAPGGHAAGHAPRTVVRPAPTQPVPTPPSTARPPAVPPATTIRPSSRATVATPGAVAAPEDGTTRYLCAAVHRRGAFTDSIIEEFLVERLRAAPPSPGLDSAAVLRDAVAARARRRARDAALLALLALLAVVAPAGILLWLVVGLVAGRPRPAGGTIRRHVVGVLQPAAAAAMVVAVPAVSAVSGIGLVGGFPAAAVAALLTLGTLAVLGADEFVVHRLVRDGPGRRVPARLPELTRGLGAPHPWSGPCPVPGGAGPGRGRDEYGPQASGRADVIVHRSRSPFIGAGLALETQTIALPLEPVINPSGCADPTSSAPPSCTNTSHAR